MFAHKPCLLISLRETVVTIKVVIEIGAKLEIHHRYLALRRLHQNYDPQMADTSKDELLLDGGIRTSQLYVAVSRSQ